jgi:peptidoglycan/xylan/chitin deacetylase (PgdA/CDA1 family)
MRMGFARSAAGVMALLFGVANVAGATGVGSQPLAVQGASLTQNGEQLIWQLQMSEPFSPGALARDRRALCLLVERADNGAVTGQLCLVGPRKGQRAPQVRYASVINGVSGQARAIDATITRDSNRDLTASFLPSGVGAAYKPLRWQVLSTLGPPACTTSGTGIPPAGACRVLFPARPALLKLHTPKLVGCVATGSKWVFNGPANARDIALTFDDGPWVQTPQFLDVLERYHVPATFFQIGEWISVYGQDDRLERRMLRDGDMIGDHTWTHPNYTGTGPYERMQVVRAADAIRAATGFYPCLFRAPYGNTSPAQLAQIRSLGMTTIQWDIDPRDWALPGVAAIEDDVLTNARNGGIVEMHDGGGPRQETIDALPTIITTLRKRGYRFVTITQMLGYRLIYK